ncbi:hypothetical protein J6590_080361 [Homalodisca vitripennis]|nr:hypothetical protein J6590_080361 [Homalodisca vitripennis]
MAHDLKIKPRLKRGPSAAGDRLAAVARQEHGKSKARLWQEQGRGRERVTKMTCWAPRWRSAVTLPIPKGEGKSFFVRNTFPPCFSSSLEVGRVNT